MKLYEFFKKEVSANWERGDERWKWAFYFSRVQLLSYTNHTGFWQLWGGRQKHFQAPISRSNWFWLYLTLSVQEGIVCNSLLACLNAPDVLRNGLNVKPYFEPLSVLCVSWSDEPEDLFYCPLVAERSVCVSTCCHSHRTSVRGELWPLGGAADATSSLGHRRKTQGRRHANTWGQVTSRRRTIFCVYFYCGVFVVFDNLKVRCVHAENNYTIKRWNDFVCSVHLNVLSSILECWEKLCGIDFTFILF